MKSKITFFLLVINSIILSQPQISWIREYDTSSPDESGISVTETNDHDGYIICGYRNMPVSLQDLFLIRTNISGDTVWTRQYGVENGSDYGMKILKTGDGYIIAGMKTKYSILNFTGWLLKIDENGDTLWTKTLLDSARIMSVCPVPGGGFAITGTQSSGIYYKAFAAKTDSEGNLIWLNFYGDYADCFGLSIISTSDNGFAILGSVNAPPVYTDDLWLIKLNGQGTKEFDYVYDFDCSWGKIIETYDGSFLLGVSALSNLSFLKLDVNGDLINSLSYLGEEYDIPDLIQSADSNYICLYTDVFGINDYSNIIVQKMDQDLNGIWSKTISGDRYYSDFSFALSEDNSLTVTGWSSSLSGDDRDILLVKLEGDIIPVELLSFKAIAEKDHVFLTWETASEVNNYGFAVQKTFTPNDGNWKEIGVIQGNGTTTKHSSYSFTDLIQKSVPVYYRLKQIDLNGTFTYSQEIKVEFSPVQFSLEQNYPNPFNPATTINYSIPRNALVRLEVYNILGERVTTLVNETKFPGNYSIKFNGSRYCLRRIYLQLTAGESILVRKMLLIK